jgi:hypothetical protein
MFAERYSIAQASKESSSPGFKCRKLNAVEGTVTDFSKRELTVSL